MIHGKEGATPIWLHSILTADSNLYGGKNLNNLRNISLCEGD